MLAEHVPYSEVGVMENQVAEADTGNPLLRVLEVTRTAEGLVGASITSAPRLAPVLVALLLGVLRVRARHVLQVAPHEVG